MKKSKFLLISCLLFIGTTTLSSCSFIDDIFDKIQGDDKKDNINSGLEGEADITISVGKEFNLEGSVLKPNEYEMSLGMEEIVNYGLYNVSYVPSVGNANILVLPIDLTGTVSNIPFANSSTNKEKIRKAFFAETGDSDLYYESVASFYKKSSFGKLNITGEVADWYNVKNSGYSSFKQIKDENDVIKIMNDAINYLKIDTTKFDANNDNIIDGVWLIYNYYDYATAQSRGIAINDNFWAYTYWDQEDKSSAKTPQSNVFAWASYDFMLEGGTKYIDSHTYIHETGHMLGLDDYYDYNRAGAPTGLVDMMDANIIDHNSFSKVLLGWVKPYIVTGDVLIQLSNINDENNCIIVPYENVPIRTENGKKYFNPFDEYMLIEYYSPTGLNKKDSDTKYPGNNVQGFTTSGFRVYHVDSRLWYIQAKKSFYSVDYYNNQSLNINTDYIKYATSNTGEGNDGENEETIYQDIKNLDTGIIFSSNAKVSNYYNKIALIDKIDRYNSYSSPYKTRNNLVTADNKCLFESGDSFSIKKYSSAFIKGTFNNGKTFDSTIVFE